MKVTLYLLILVLSVTVHAATNHFADIKSPSPTPPYTNWVTAAHTTQDAVDAAGDGDTVWVTNGVYDTGGVAGYPVGSALTNRVAIYRPVTVRAVSTNPADTVIKGNELNTNATVRGVCLSEGATLIGFTITSAGLIAPDDYPAAGFNGGGIWATGSGTTVSNCIIIGNGADAGGGVFCDAGTTISDSDIINNFAYGDGGGVYGGTLSGCTLSNNEADQGDGGGAYGSVLKNCTLLGNSAENGGGAFGSTIFNCRVRHNRAENGGGAQHSTLYGSTVTENVASDNGGGADWCTLRNCTVVGNTTPWQGGGVVCSTLSNCIV